MRSTHIDKDCSTFISVSIISFVRRTKPTPTDTILTSAAIVSSKMIKLTQDDKAIHNFSPNFSYLLGNIDSLSPCHHVCSVMILSSIEVDKSIVDLSV